MIWAVGNPAASLVSQNVHFATKKLPLLLILSLLIPIFNPSAFAEDTVEKNSSYRFEFRVTKQRDREAEKDQKGTQRKPEKGQPPRPGENVDSEMWGYKVEVENRSLEDTPQLEAKYTIYLGASKRRGGPRDRKSSNDSSVSTVTGEATLAPIARGNRESFETVSSAITRSGRSRGRGPQGGGPGGGGSGPGGDGPGGQGRPPGDAPNAPAEAQKLDGIKVELFLGETKVGEHLYGNGAKRAARAENKQRKESERRH